MSRKQAIDMPPGYGRLLDCWDAPDTAGETAGILTTSFTFNAAFFEEACLSRFLGMTTDPDEDGPIYLIEREEKLAGLQGATVLVDAHHCRGTRSLRWDLLPVQVEGGGVLHAKVSLLPWSKLLRVIVTSANMTEEAYRRNREIFGVLDYCSGSAAPRQVADTCINLLRDCLARTYRKDTEPRAAQARAMAVLDNAQSFVNGLELNNSSGRKKKTLQIEPVITAPGSTDIFSQLQAYWPGGLPATAAYVTSPFFDLQSKANASAVTLWSVLRQRGQAEVTFNVLADEIENESAIFVHAPQSLLEAMPSQRSNVATQFVRLPNELPSASGMMTYRPLHMKQLWLENDNWAMALIGSSNFTSAGMGLGKVHNIEANLLYITPTDSQLPFYRLLNEAYPDGEPIDTSLEIRWQPIADDELENAKQMPVLPNGFGQALYDRDEDGRGFLLLELNTSLPTEWTICLPQSDEVVLDAATWKAQTKPPLVRINWGDVLAPSGLEVTWKECAMQAWWPVNIVSSQVLAPPQELQALPLELLIQILTSSRPLHEVLRNWLRRHQKDQEQQNDKSLIDPHKRVDTSSFLLQRTRRFSWALSAIKQRLEQAVATPEILHWRLWGPVGVDALAKAIANEARSEEEQVFLISELILELANIQPQTAPGCLKPVEVKAALQPLLTSLAERIESRVSTLVTNLQVYVQEILAGVRHGV